MMEIKKYSLIDLTFISFDMSSYEQECFPHFINRFVDKSNLNPLFEPFRSIMRLNLNYVDLNTALAYLADARDLNFKINHLLLSLRNSEELDALTNPEIYEKEVKNLHLLFKLSFALTDEVLFNISTIMPKSLRLNFYKEIHTLKIIIENAF